MVFYKKQGYPEVGELVVCEVKRILPHAAFLELIEYDKKEGMLHVSEMSSRWVKNIRNYVTEGKQVVCKVMRTDSRTGHIDLSLKRVSDVERENKFNQWKIEKKMDNLLKIIGSKIKNKKLSYEDVGEKIVNHYGSLHALYHAFMDKEESAVKEVKLPEEWERELIEVLNKQLSSQVVSVNALFIISTNAGDGVNRVKESFNRIKKYCEDNKITFEVKYLGAPRYKVIVSSKNYKIAENQLQEVIKEYERISNELKLNFKWER